jgi:nitronate monooxygenase
MTITKDYPWTQGPFIASAPMRLIALAPLAVEVSKAGITCHFQWNMATY